MKTKEPGPTRRNQSLSPLAKGAAARIVLLGPLLLMGCKSTTTTAPSAAVLPSPATSDAVRDMECQSTKGAFVNRNFNPQKGKFMANLDMRVTTPGHTESAIGLAKGGGEGYGSMGCILYFNKDGTLTARKSRGVAADQKVGYTPNVLYHVRFEVDVPTNQYSIFVAPTGGKEEPVAVNYPFRQSDKGGPEEFWPMLNNVRLIAYPGGEKLEICNFKITEVK